MRTWNKLTAAAVARLKKPGRYSDGGNLILRISDDGHKTWAFRFMRDGGGGTAGLGSCRVLSLADAREFAAGMRKQLAVGLDPLVERDKTRAAERAAAARLLTFREAAKRFLADRKGGWRNEQ